MARRRSQYRGQLTISQQILTILIGREARRRGGLTSRELAKAIGMTYPRVRVVVARLHREGWISIFGYHSSDAGPDARQWIASQKTLDHKALILERERVVQRLKKINRELGEMP